MEEKEKNLWKSPKIGSFSLSKKQEIKIEKKKMFFNFLVYFFVFASVPVILSFVYFIKNNEALDFNFSEKFSFEAASLFGESQGKIINENDGIVLGEDTSGEVETALASSENFIIKRMSLGSDLASLDVGNEEQDLIIFDMKSESFLDKKNNLSGSVKSEEDSVVKLLISWKTNKMAVSELAYSKNGDSNQKIIKEQSYGFNHSAIVSNLDPKTSYVYSIKSRDRWGNEKNSEFFGVYTPSSPTSVFSLITKAMSDVFGWAVKR